MFVQLTDRYPLFVESGTLELGLPVLLSSFHSYPQIHFPRCNPPRRLRFQDETIQHEVVRYRIDYFIGR